MNQYKLPNIVFLLVLGFLLVGLGSTCASVTKPAGSDLQATVKNFQHDIRWHYYKSAAAVVAPDQTKAFLEWLDRAKEKLHVVDWEIREVVLARDGNEAKVCAKIRYYWLPFTVIQEQTVNQVWKLLHARWVLVSQQGGVWCFPSCDENPDVFKSNPTDRGHNPDLDPDEDD